MSNWLKCTVSMPEIYDYVLVFADNKGTGEPRPISIARLYDQGKWEFCNKAPVMPNYGAYMDMEYPMDVDDITHWMPLPPKPEEE